MAGNQFSNGFSNAFASAAPRIRMVQNYLGEPISMRNPAFKTINTNSAVDFNHANSYTFAPFLSTVQPGSGGTSSYGSSLYPQCFNAKWSGLAGDFTGNTKWTDGSIYFCDYGRGAWHFSTCNPPAKYYNRAAPADFNYTAGGHSYTFSMSGFFSGMAAYNTGAISTRVAASTITTISCVGGFVGTAGTVTGGTHYPQTFTVTGVTGTTMTVTGLTVALDATDVVALTGVVGTMIVVQSAIFNNDYSVMVYHQWGALDTGKPFWGMKDLDSTPLSYINSYQASPFIDADLLGSSVQLTQFI